jgi:pre-mRNA-processing factor 8
MNFQGVKFSPMMKYDLMLAPPLEYYAEKHRSSHFLSFGLEGGGSAPPAGGAEADREDSFR